jgi:hypothetical protein
MEIGQELGERKLHFNKQQGSKLKRGYFKQRIRHSLASLAFGDLLA